MVGLCLGGEAEAVYLAIDHPDLVFDVSGAVCNALHGIAQVIGPRLSRRHRIGGPLLFFLVQREASGERTDRQRRRAEAEP